MQIYLIKTASGFVPSDKYQWAEVEKINQGEEILAKVIKVRNPKFHKKFMALLAETFDMQDEFLNPESWRAAVTTGAGFCDFIFLASRGVVAVPRSISFENMDDLEFRKLYDDAIKFICAKYVPDLDSDELDRLMAFVG